MGYTHCKKSGLLPAVTLFTFLLSSQVEAATAELPGNIFSRDATALTTMLVDKDRRIAYLVKVDGDHPITVKNYTNLMFGENEGDKISEGDKRTPEGAYQVTSFIPENKLDKIYGTGAFPLDYPNPLDKLEGKNGSGIWLHGRDDNDAKKQDTRGCVAFVNNDISELRKILAPESQVLITRKVDFIKPARYQQERETLLNTLDRFIGAWESGDTQALDQLLHPEFRGSGGRGKSAWLKRKEYLNKKYPQRRINTDDVIVLKESPNQVVFNFTQHYCASNMIGHGKKRLFFKRNQDQLQLITEEYSRLPTTPVIDSTVKTFISNWASVWKNKEIPAYLSMYSKDFSDPKGRDLETWKTYKKALFKKRNDQKINISDIDIKPLFGNRYRVSFRQHYQSREFQDYGLKTLILEGCPGDLAIISENWKSL